MNDFVKVLWDTIVYRASALGEKALPSKAPPVPKALRRRSSNLFTPKSTLTNVLPHRVWQACGVGTSFGRVGYRW